MGVKQGLGVFYGAKQMLSAQVLSTCNISYSKCTVILYSCLSFEIVKMVVPISGLHKFTNDGNCITFR